TNSLIVRGVPLDVLTIRSLLTRYIDTMPDSDSVIKPFTIKLKHASAADVYYVLKDIYRESMNNNPRGFVPGNGLFGQNQPRNLSNIDANGNPRGVTLALTYDDKTNAILLTCPTTLYKEIKTLVDEQLDVPTKAVIDIVGVPNVDPNILQGAIDALSGKRGPPRPGGFTPRGGGLMRGGGGGPFGNPFFRGGGGFGGRFAPGPGQRVRSPGGPDFFAQGVKDDPPVLFDPQRDDK